MNLQEFAERVYVMRDAQKVMNAALDEADDYSEALIYVRRAEVLEHEIDELLKQIRSCKKKIG
ncbi:MAG: hypothetical protein IKY66_03425 [Bacteroidales bacterium]|nr:hypothetical protein [Bacteroidales bacterium]